MRKDVAAIFVLREGPYPTLVQRWFDGFEGRDAFSFSGPEPVVAHPPCAAWGEFAKRWRGGYGDDGEFEFALRTVREFGGVLEHPEGTAAWPTFGLPIPSDGPRWVAGPRFGEWVCSIRQSEFGHRAPKPTWLFYVGYLLPPPVLAPIGEPEPALFDVPRTGHHYVERMSHRERAETPLRLARALVDLAGADP